MIERPRLVALPGHGDRSRPDVHFCGHCGRQPQSADIQPSPQDPFLLVDGQLSICAVSRLAETLLMTSETEVVNSHIGDLLVPADVEIGGPESLVNLIVHAARGPGETHHVAALVVLADGRA